MKHSMPKSYSQLRASVAIAKASLLAMLRSPTSVVFSLLFPIIFIVVFGAMVDTNKVNIVVAFTPQSEIAGILYKSILSAKVLQIAHYTNEEAMYEDLKKGRIAAIIDARADSRMAFIPHYQVKLISSSSSADKTPMVHSILQDVIAGLNARLFPKNFSVASLSVEKLPGRVYKSIDFILPGQLGFSLLMAGVFGSAFLLFSLRQSLVIKRFFATPISRFSLILGEMLSRFFFQIIGFAIMVGLGYFAFGFTLVHGLLTFAEMLFLSIFGLIIFMGIGFIVSGVIENESSIAPVANTITLPQILLCGLFFPIDNYPAWLQSFCRILPLTFFVDGLRKIAFEGIHIWQMPVQMAGLLIWGLIIGFITVRVFRWE
ncbi:MAG: ABC transporter permease [Bacteroidetes bacterium]|nr:MAG: ABC transporter permease [Bacteroidota bacterium]